MSQLEKSSQVDVLRIVSLLRQDRGGMVQTSSQYHFIYKVSYTSGSWLIHCQGIIVSFFTSTLATYNGLAQPIYVIYNNWKSFQMTLVMPLMMTI